MNSAQNLRRLALVTLAAAPLGNALATNGYFSHGYGMKAKGMAGASLAMSQDAFAGATNPAAAAWAGNRIDGGIDLFRPIRDMANARAAASTLPSRAAAIPS